jgi:Glucodextranase, domain B
MRRLALVPLAALLLTPAAASAFTSTITSPTAGTRLVFDHTTPPLVHFAGTADSGPVDLKCVTSNAGSISVGTTPIASNVTVSGGSFSTDAPMPSNADLCEVFAVPAGTIPATNTDLNGLSGALVYSAISYPYSAGGKVYDFDVDVSSPKAYDQLESFGDYPMEYQEPILLHEYGPFVLDGGAALFDQDPTSSTPAPSLRIDGRPAYTAAYIGYSSLQSLAGWSGLTFAVTNDSGAFRVVSNEGTFHCAGGTAPDAFPPDATSCGGFASSGVGVTADERLSADGRTVTQNLTLTSTDNQSHTFAPVFNDLTEVARDWFFPGTSGFLSYGTGTAVSPVPAGPVTIRNRVTGDPSKDFGAITYVRQPTDEIFSHPGDSFAQHYAPITIPANGSARFEFIYSIATTSDGLDALVAANEASIGAAPAISVTSATTATAAAYTLAGTVNAPETVNAFTVNGQPAAIGSNGAFSLPETLATGANSFTLAATDELGRTTTTPFTVTLSSTPPPASNPLSVRFGHSGKPKVRGRVVTTGLTATCPGAGPSCSISGRATAGRKLAGKGAATVKAGATAAIKLKLTKKAAALLKRKHKLKLKLKLTGKRPGAATTTATRTLKLSAPRKG